MSRQILVSVFVLNALAWAVQATAQQASNNPQVPAVTHTSPDYQVGPGDVLSIRVSGVREFDQALRVSNSGRVRVPYVGIVFAAGMTSLELEREIATKIKEHELVNEPVVRVQVQQHRARPVHVVGEVATPGQFVITGEMYLLDLITRAGGLSGGASGTGILYRRGIPRPSVTAKLMVDGAATDAAAFEAAPSEPVPSEPVPSAPAPSEPVPSAPAPSEPVPSEPAAGELPAEAQVIKVNLDELREGKRPDLNIPLQGGDVLYIPRRQGRTIYIIGDVKIPGAYNLPRRGTVSAAQALVYAGGPMLTAKNSAGFLMRHKANGERQAIPIDFIDIIKGRKPDIPVQADDIIFIPNSAAKTIGVNLLNQIPRLLQQLVIF